MLKKFLFIFALLLFGLAPVLAASPLPDAPANPNDLTKRAVLPPQPIYGPYAEKGKGVPKLGQNEAFVKFNQINQCVKVNDPKQVEHALCLTNSTSFSAAVSYDGAGAYFGFFRKILKLSKKINGAKISVYSTGVKIGW